MFSEVIRSTPFTRISALENILADNYGGDVSFDTTLKLLVGSRTTDIFRGAYASYILSSYNDKNRDVVRVKNMFRRANGLSDNTITICSVRVSADCMDNAFNIAVGCTGVFEEYGFERVEKVTRFYNKAFNVAAFINKDLKNAIIYVEDLDIRKAHYIQCSIPGVLPWYFESNKLSKKEVDLLYALKENTSDKYLNIVNSLYKDGDWEEKIIRNKLSGFENKYIEERMNIVMGHINSLDNDMQRYKDKIRDLMEQRFNYNIELSGLMNNNSDEHTDEIMNYFLKRKNMHLVECSGRNITFMITSKLSVWDEEAAKAIIFNHNARLYYSCSDATVSKDDLSSVLKAIFLDKKYRINMIGTYKLDILYSVSGVSSVDYNSKGFVEYLPNPHINEYACIGMNGMDVETAISNRQYTAAFDQCVHSANQISFNDAPVMEAFGRYLCRYINKFIEDKDGNKYSVKDLIKKLKESDQ